MRDGREIQLGVTQPAEPALVIVRGPAGIGKTGLVRRWTASLPSTAVLWPHVTPPRNAHNFWMRVLTQLHARGWITDQELFRAIGRAGQQNGSIRDITGEVLSRIPESPVIVIDDLHGVLDDDVYLEIVSDLSSFLHMCDRMRAVIIESSPSPIDTLDLPAHLIISEAHLPPVAFLGRGTGAHASYRSPAPGLHTLVHDPQMLRDICLVAIPHEVDAEIAAALTGRDGPALLETLARWGLGSLQASAHGPRFVFRAEVRTEARAELRRYWPEALSTAARRLSELALSRGRWEPAFEYATLTEDASFITRIGLRMNPFPMDFTPQMFEGITALPLEQVRSNPMLGLLAATVAEHSPRRDQSAAELYQHSADAAHASRRGSNATERLVMLGVESYALHRSGNMSAAVNAAQIFSDRARTMIDERQIDPELAHVFGNFAYQAAVTLIAGDEFTTAIALLRDLDHYCLAHGIDYRRRFALAGRAFLEALGGRLPAARALAQMADVPPAPPMKRSRSYRAFLDSEAVIRAGMAGDFPALHRAVAAFRARPHEMHWDILLFGEVLLDIATGNTGAARVRFDEAVGTHLVPSTSKTTARRASYLRSVLVLLGENPRLLGTAGTRMSEDPISLAFSAGRDIDHGDYDAASGKLSKAAAGARTPFQEHVVFTMLARLGIAGQDADSTRDSASHLLVLARTHKLKIAFALLADDERARILDSLGSPAELRAAFAATRPLTIDNAPTNTSMLTARQLDVIRALAEFGSRQEVAKKLFLSPGTVKAHLRAIYKKLDAHNQAEALYKAAALGLLQKR